MTEFFDRQGNPMDLIEWATTFENDEYRRVAYRREGDVAVSTCWMGFDQGLNLLGGPPAIFETAIFVYDRTGIPSVTVAARAVTEEQALEDHALAMSRVWPEQVLDTRGE